jgi:EAL domain-containing protein (putative c-di-GMP-specific phosphodiesterase class I)
MREARRAETTVAMTPDMKLTDGFDNKQIEFDLERAIQYGELVPWYQPVVEPRSGEVIGAEALLRWHSPEHGIVGPDRFLPQIENTGRVHDLTRHVVNAVLRDIDHLGGERDYWFSVNASVRNLRDRDFVEIVADALAVWDVDATRLIVEITESALMTDAEVSIETVTRLCDMGIRVAIDDFGSGYSNMTYLKDLPAWELKIDRSLITDIDKKTADRKIVRSIIQLARALQLRVVAEGIETAEVAAVVADLGCDYAQGFFYGRPMPLDQLAELLNAPAKLAV